MANYLLDQTGAEVQAILNAVQNPDTTPAEGSSKLITSGGVQAALAGTAAQIGTLSNLDTTDKSSLVAAVNELEAGKADQSEVAALGQKVDGLALGKFYGFVDDVADLPVGDEPGYAYVGASSPFAIYNFNGNTWSDSGAVYGPQDSGNEIDAIQGGMIPDNPAYADFNAEKFVELVNSGYFVLANNTFYIGTATTKISHDVKVRGNGSFIKTTDAASFEISSPITLELSGLSLIGDYAPGLTVFSILFTVATGTHIYNPSVLIENCHINNVRVYSHIADDVDQTTIKDGVKQFIFRNNIVTNIGYYVIRLGDCLSEYVEISGNRATNFMSVLFDLGVDNNYQSLAFPRMKSVQIFDNCIDNDGYVMHTGNTAVYHTPFIIESGACVFNNNTIKNILCDANSVAVYAAYISSDKVEMRGNYIYNVINLVDSTYNECFKSKGSTGGNYERVICGNTYVVTEDVVSGYSPSIKMFSLQGAGGAECDLIDVSDNVINVPGCDFVWGGAVQLVYHNASMCRNHIVCKNVGTAAAEMFRLANNTDADGCIFVVGNKMSAKSVSGTANTIIREAAGYKITIEDNQLVNLLPWGQYDTVYENLEIISRRNKILLSSSPGTIRPYNVNVSEDIIYYSTGAGIRLYPNLVNDFKYSLSFPNKYPSAIELNWSGDNAKGLYKITISCALGENSVLCRADESQVMLVSDNGAVYTCSRTATETSQSVPIPLSQTISLGSVSVAGKDVTIQFSSYLAGLSATITIEKHNALPNINAFGNKHLLASAGNKYVYNNSLRPYLVWDNGRLGYVDNGRMYGANGLRDGALSGDTASRPTMGSADKGFIYFDTTLGKSIVWNGSAWVNMDGSALA